MSLLVESDEPVSFVLVANAGGAGEIGDGRMNEDRRS
jgi:hypothetical protein